MRNFSFLFFLSMLLLTGCAQPQASLEHRLPPGCGIYDMRQARCIDATELAARLAFYRVVFVGDHHSKPQMHRSIGGLVTELARSGRQVSVANEWFIPEDDALLRSYTDGSLDGNLSRAIDWKKRIGYPFDSYEPLYRAVRDVKGGLYGINMRHQFKEAVSDANVSAMTPLQRDFYAGLDLNLSAHRQMLSPFFAHCHSPRNGEDDERCSIRMYRVQVAWDSYMAGEAARLASTVLRSPEDLLIVFAGAMHLYYGLGINARFARLSREPFVTILPVQDGTAAAEVGSADYLLVYSPDPADPGQG